MNDNDDGPGKPKRRITAVDVANQAGVSRSAVSRAFTEGAYLDAEKRRRIMKAAQELGYRPNALAAGLQGRRSNLVAIFVGEMSNEFDKEMATQLVAGLNEIGKWPIVIGGSGDTARNAVSNVLSYPLDAMILRSGSLDADIVDTCAKLNIPVISSGRILEAHKVDSVCAKNQSGMAKGTRFLIEQGRSRFAYIGGPSALYSSPQRRAGFQEALDEAGLAPVAEAVGEFTVQSGYEAAQRLCSGSDFDALVCANDAMAVGALSALRETGRRVPRDVSVIGFDNIAMADWPAISLTTLNNPIPESVQAIIDLLQKRSEDPDRPEETILLDVDLVLRKSH